MKKLIEEVLGFEVVEIFDLEKDLAPVETIYEDKEISIEILEDQATYYATLVENGYEFIGYYKAK